MGSYILKSPKFFKKSHEVQIGEIRYRCMWLHCAVPLMQILHNIVFFSSPKIRIRQERSVYGDGYSVLLSSIVL